MWKNKGCNKANSREPKAGNNKLTLSKKENPLERTCKMEMGKKNKNKKWKWDCKTQEAKIFVWWKRLQK